MTGTVYHLISLSLAIRQKQEKVLLFSFVHLVKIIFSFINKTFGIENFRILCTSIYSILEATISLLHNMSKIKLVRFLELRLFEFPLSKRELLYLVHHHIKNKGRYLFH